MKKRIMAIFLTSTILLAACGTTRTLSPEEQRLDEVMKPVASSEIKRAVDKPGVNDKYGDITLNYAVYCENLEQYQFQYSAPFESSDPLYEDDKWIIISIITDKDLQDIVKIGASYSSDDEDPADTPVAKIYDDGEEWIPVNELGD